MSEKVSIPKGTRDFNPDEVVKRTYIFDTIKNVFRRYGYAPIETPSFERLSTLLGKYGDEGDKLLFRILNSGDFLSKTERSALTTIEASELSSQISEKGLRYDLTVPFARYVVQYQNDITFPFKRYQIQPVWRADRPQKGRYQEFYQCDADVVGSTSLLNEAELLQMVDEVFGALGMRVVIKLNNRKILAGIAHIVGEADKITDITVAIDKLDKIGIDKVNEELASKGVSTDAIGRLQPILHLSGSNREKLKQLRSVLADTEIGLLGVSEIETVLDYTDILSLQSAVELDLTLARGLNYYTGAIIEVKALDAQMGSISGGGRYDNLTGIFGLPNVSGVGVSFGADRIYDVMLQLNLFPASNNTAVRVLFANFGEAEQRYCMPLVAKVRQAGIAAELYPDQSKMKKQMGYADKKGIPFVALAGENEMQQNILTLKNMKTGEQQAVSIEQLIEIVAH